MLIISTGLDGRWHGFLIEIDPSSFRIMTEQEKQEIRDMVKAEIELKLQSSASAETAKEKSSPTPPESRTVNVETVSPTY